MAGMLYIVGVGPGHHDHMTRKARQAIERSDTIVGYATYVNLVEDLIGGKDVYSYAMTQEVERARQCIDLAESGRVVSLVSSGDPGIYGMAGLIYEMAGRVRLEPRHRPSRGDNSRRLGAQLLLGHSGLAADDRLCRP